ncbi:hypothetical protein DPMN_027969 [Dreissena polymorpha]|uniref:Uncharacterized protein n=1 Tax=Dreissena polymorpha TaxID=45954 RepID=A0A9D4LVS8_DREPO|nr:hypothetical protein DPMN_027969 [Dreissena polymorpha]
MLDIVEYNAKRELVKINPDKSELLTLKCKQPIQVTFVKHLGVDRTKNTVDPDVRLKIGQRKVNAELEPELHARRGLSPKVYLHV